VLLDLLLPTAIGALIGYLDHWIVVKLVFWPRREYRVFGRRVPLTPGVFAARRRDFAVAVARLIEERFVTGDGLYKSIMTMNDDGSLKAVCDDYPAIGWAFRFYFSRNTARDFARDCEKFASRARDSKMVSESVRSSIDAMSIDEVEDMVMSVIASELRLVIWLGAPLGAVVGFLQAL
jgi:uncharacterized membrane protein YheB (UPF0754 family)